MSWNPSEFKIVNYPYVMGFDYTNPVAYAPATGIKFSNSPSKTKAIIFEPRVSDVILIDFDRPLAFNSSVYKLKDLDDSVTLTFDHRKLMVEFCSFLKRLMMNSRGQAESCLYLFKNRYIKRYTTCTLSDAEMTAIIVVMGVEHFLEDFF